MPATQYSQFVRFTGLFYRSSPVAHAILVDVAFKGNRPRSEYGSGHTDAVIAQFAPKRFALMLVQRCIAFEDVRAAEHQRRRHIVHLRETGKGARKVGLRKPAAETDLASDVFQVSIPPKTKTMAVPARILDGRAIAAELRDELLTRTTALRETGVHPRLVITLVGEDESSRSYVRNLVRTGERAGIIVDVDALPQETSTAAVRARLERFGGDPAVHGVMLQQPLPAPLAIRAIADAIPRHKDVDGAHPTNQGHLAFGSGAEFVPATPAAVMLLLERCPHWPLKGRRAVMIGRSIVVGAPVAMLMLAQDATVTVLHKESASLQPYVRMAEIVVVATGVPALIGGADIAPGATVIDVGTTMIDGVLHGDVDFASASAVAGAITPVPGGVGPVTNVALLRNVLDAASRTSVRAS